MSVKIKEGKSTIEMTRGDTLIVEIKIYDDSGEQFTPDPEDSLRFALKKDYNDPEVLIYKNIPIDTMELRLEPEDTKPLEQPATYYYDIQLTYGGGIVSTVIPNGQFKITEEVE